MKPMESLISLATAVVVAGDGMESQWWRTLTAGGGRPFAYSGICGRVSMLKSRSRFSLLGQTPGERGAVRARRVCQARREARESSCSRRWKTGPGCPINRELSRPIEHALDLARHDEIVLVQSLDLLGGERDGHVTPAEADIGVMAFGLGELADALHEGERLPEIAESKRALDAMGVIAQLPIRRLLLETQRFIARKRRNAAATGRAGFFREGLGHVLSC